jgi:hypothetical protein
LQSPSWDSTHNRFANSNVCGFILWWFAAWLCLSLSGKCFFVEIIILLCGNAYASLLGINQACPEQISPRNGACDKDKPPDASKIASRLVVSLPCSRRPGDCGNLPSSAELCVCHGCCPSNPIKSPRSTQTVEEKDPTGRNSRSRGTVSPENGPRKLYLNILTTEIVPTNKQNKTNRGKKDLGSVPNFLRVGRQKDDRNRCKTWSIYLSRTKSIILFE